MLLAAIALLPAGYLALPPHHTEHLARLGAGQSRISREVLAAVDRVQARAMDGGGYFIGIKADPPESPVGYDLSFGGQPLLKAPRRSSYCSGSSYAALIEALDRLYTGPKLAPWRLEELRMQEPDGGRREDGIKAWGWWNADGPGSHYALVDYLGIGRRVAPAEARPGDFANVSWKNGPGHSVVFLGWTRTASGEPAMAMWSSQTGTNGYGDLISPFSKIAGVVVVRLEHPEKLAAFTPGPVTKKVAYDRLDPEMVPAP